MAPPTFHRFLDLPYELRQMVYDFSLQPRIISFLTCTHTPSNHLSITPPSLLHVFHESRQFALQHYHLHPLPDRPGVHYYAHPSDIHHFDRIGSINPPYNALDFPPILQIHNLLLTPHFFHNALRYTPYLAPQDVNWRALLPNLQTLYVLLSLQVHARRIAFVHVKTESVVPFDEGAASWEMVRVKEGVEVSWRLSGRNKGWGGRTDADIGLMFVQPREGWVCNVDGTGRGRGRGREAVRGSDS